MKTMLAVLLMIGALVTDVPVAWRPWLTDASLKLTLSRSAKELTRYFKDATNSDWLQFIDGLTPNAKIRLSLLGQEFRFDGQAEVAKTIRCHHELLRGLTLKASNAVVVSEAGRLASVLVQAVVGSDGHGFAEPVMLRLALIKVNGRWLIHQVETVEGYISLI